MDGVALGKLVFVHDIPLSVERNIEACEFVNRAANIFEPSALIARPSTLAKPTGELFVERAHVFPESIEIYGRLSELITQIIFPSADMAVANVLFNVGA